eukprot:gene7078-7875_t
MASTIGEVSHIDNNNNNAISNNVISNNRNSLSKLKPLPPISKIPGLNPDSDAIASAEQKTFRTFKVLETDSSYIKLAKQGGRKNLLQYNEYCPKALVAGRMDVVNKENLVLKKRPDLLDYQEHSPAIAQKSPAENASVLTESEDNNNNNLNDVMTRVDNESVNKSVRATAGKSIIEIRKQSMNMKNATATAKERADILPIDNVEILKHLNVPRRQILPRIKNQPRKMRSHSFRVGK